VGSVLYNSALQPWLCLPLGVHEDTLRGICEHLMEHVKLKRIVISICLIWRMPSSEIWRCVAPVKTEVSEECIASIVRVKRISELGTMSPVSVAGSTFSRHICHVKGTSTPHLTRIFGQVGHSWIQYQPVIPQSVSQYLCPHHKNQIHGPHC
jgi:hypothetical protein